LAFIIRIETHHRTHRTAVVQWQPTSDILTAYISSRPMACTSGCNYSF